MTDNRRPGGPPPTRRPVPPASQAAGEVVRPPASQRQSLDRPPEAPPEERGQQSAREEQGASSATAARAQAGGNRSTSRGGDDQTRGGKLLAILGLLTGKLGSAIKGADKKMLLIFGAGLVLIVAVVIGALFYFGVFDGIGTSVLPMTASPSNSPTTTTVIPQDIPPSPVYNGWNLDFKVPANRLEWGLAWELVWVVLALLNLFFRTETRHRGEVWDWINVTTMVLFALLAFVSARGLVTIAVEQCYYWLVTDCTMGTLSVALIESVAPWFWLLAGLVVFVGSAVASFTGRLDLTSWAVGTYTVGILAKMLLPTGAAQIFATGVVWLGFLIYVLEIAGVAKGKFAASGLVALLFGLIVMIAGTLLLSLAFGYLSTAGMPTALAVILYQGRFLWGLTMGWLVATAVTYMVTPAIAPQIERLGTGSIVVGDSEKIDTVMVLLMVVGAIFVFSLAPMIAAFV